VESTCAIGLATKDFVEPVRFAFQLDVIVDKFRRISFVATKGMKRRAVRHTSLQMVLPLSSTGLASSSVTTPVNDHSTAESTNARRRATNKTPNRHTVPGLLTLCLTAPVVRPLYPRYQILHVKPAKIGYRIVPKLARRRLTVATNAHSLVIKVNAYPV
jgi:hypothetical protein